MRPTVNIFFRLVSNGLRPNCRTFCAVHREASVAKSSAKTQSLEAECQEHSYFRRGLPLSDGDYRARKSIKPTLPLNPQILKVAILGEPNVGKSTLTNALVKWKVCAVSKKVHTTRKKTAAIFVENEKQIVFLDTPGFITPEHSKKHKLEVSLVVDPENSVREADLIAVIVDVANKWTNKRIHEDILELLNKFKEKTSILILNKVDAQKHKQEILGIVKCLTRRAINGVLVPELKSKNMVIKRKKRSLEEIITRTEKVLGMKPEVSAEDDLTESLDHFSGAKGWPFFSQVFMVSALKNEGVDDLRNFFLESAKPGEWVYDGRSVIDTHPYEIATTIVRQVLLEDLPQEVPYSVQLVVKSWDVDSIGCLRIHIAIVCSKSRYKSLIIGYAGIRIAKFTENSRQALQDAFRSEIYLKLGVE